MRLKMLITLFIPLMLVQIPVAHAAIKIPEPTKERHVNSIPFLPALGERDSFWKPITGGEWEWVGEFGARWVGGENESARFNEYRDLTDWFFGNIVGDFSKENYYVGIVGSDIARDDQYYHIKGGKYHDFKYLLYYDQLPHNYSYNARTFYTVGVGSGLLTYTFPDNAGFAAFTPSVPTNTEQWDPLKYSISKKDLGGKVDLFIDDTLSVSLGANQVWKDGLKPAGVSSGVKASQTSGNSSAVGAVVEYPETIDFSTTNVFTNFNYRKDNLFGSLDFLYSRFSNEYEWITWRNPYVSTQTLNDTSSIAPDNNYFKIDARGIIRDLPLDSSLALRGGYAFIKNNITLLNSITNYASGGGGGLGMPTYFTTPLTLNRPDFTGDIKYWNLSMVLSSEPMENLDTELYVRETIKENDSPIISYTESGNTTISSLFHYQKLAAGGEAGYKLPLETKFFGGYDFSWVRRYARPDAIATFDNIINFKLKNSFFDFMTLNFKYSWINRSSVFGNSLAGTTPTANNGWINRYIRRFDATDKWGQVATAALDFYLIENMDIGLEYSFNTNRYDKTVIGRYEDEGQSGCGDISYKFPGIATVSGFFYVEDIKYLTQHRRYGSTGSANPFIPPTSTAYNWTTDVRDQGWSYGFGLDVPAVENKLDLSASWSLEKSNGSIDFFPQGGVVNLIPIDRYDGYRKSIFQAKVVYKRNKRLTTTIGYLYEKFRLFDISFDSYSFVRFPSQMSRWFLTGAYNDHDYDANMIYASASYAL